MIGRKSVRKVSLSLSTLFLAAFAAFAQDAPQNALTPVTTRAVGTISTISGQVLTIKTDAGAEMSVTVTDTTKLLQLKPGQKDLKEATPLSLSDLKAGDRILVRGAVSADAKSMQATSVIAMKQTDIADKQARDRAEWQRNGVGGLVKAVDAGTGLVSLTTNGVGTPKEISVHVTKTTILRRYAPDSVKFDDAKAAPIADIKAGDQLRARGQKNADGTEITADEIVSGTFRNIAGILVSSDSAAGTLTVTDLATKQPVTVRITGDSQLRKLPPMMAQGIAMRLKGTPAAGPAGAGNGPGSPPAATLPPQASAGAAPAAGAPPAGATAAGGAGARGGFGAGQGRGGAGDFQQMIARMPASSVSDFQKGDALMIVATEGSATVAPTVITLLAGVEPILQASSKATPDMILSPWTLGGGGGGEGATP